jgi:hypothetical protein
MPYAAAVVLMYGTIDDHYKETGKQALISWPGV